MCSSDSLQLHNVFVYGSFQDPDVINVMLDRTPEIVSATLPGLYVPFSVSSSIELFFCIDLRFNGRFWFCSSVKGLGLKDVCIHVLFLLRKEKFMARFDS